MANWMPASPSSQTLFSSMAGDNIGSKAVSESTCKSESGFSFHGYTEHPTDSRDELQAQSAIDQTSGFSAMSEQNIGSRGGLLERMAARAGFHAPRPLNTETIRPGDLSQNQEVPSSYLTIPPGLSPTTLLESPVFLSNSQAQPSPTTGKFTFVPSGNSQNSGLYTESADKNNENIFGGMDGSSFAFRPAPSQYFGSSDRAPFPNIEVSVQSENTMAPQMLEHSKAAARNQQAGMENTGGVNMSEQTTGTASTVLEHSSPFDDEEPDNEADQRGGDDVIGGDAPDDDGYNWKKYGQKQVKRGNSPCSYYKCTYINCPLKKKVVRSLQGHITEIVYKGIHNHPKPPAHRRSALGSSGAFGNMHLENGEHAFTGGDVDPAWTSIQRGNIPSDWRQDNLDMTSSTMLGSQYGTGATSLRIQNNSQFESGDAADRSSTFSNDEDADERGTHGSASVGYDGEGDESESKKRKVEAYPVDMSGATRGIREPRVVVQTTSEVDILDDGYRWRKYGQKVVKGNPNPRSYYKCTSVGCSVRKHVERASHDLKSVITTYEGKHNHEVPAARNSSHVNSGNAATGAQSHVHRPEMTPFDRTASLRSYGLPNRPHLIPPHDFGYGMNQRTMPNLNLGGYGGCSQGQLPSLQGQQYMGQQRPMNEMAFMLPKGEPKVDPMSDSGLSLPNASSVYQQAMMRMPLGPHM